MRKPATLFASAFFAAFALAHLARLSFGVSVMIGTWYAPKWVSGLAVVVGLVLSLKLERERRS
jgi:hypothetical protein